jgi:hypothetical protein
LFAFAACTFAAQQVTYRLFSRPCPEAPATLARHVPLAIAFVDAALADPPTCSLLRPDTARAAVARGADDLGEGVEAPAALTALLSLKVLLEAAPHLVLQVCLRGYP